jgi:hypothetical protein
MGPNTSRTEILPLLLDRVLKSHDDVRPRSRFARRC